MGLFFGKFDIELEDFDNFSQTIGLLSDMSFM